MSNTFESLYKPLLKEVFTEQAREQMARGAEVVPAARMYAELGKPDFVLAFLLLSEQSEEEKRAVFARAYERRAELSTAKAAEYSTKFHRPFPLMKLEARKDLQAAQAIRQGQPLAENI
ncbi:MAG: hypothetical protein ACRDHW_01005 [Ktedonobacteraceae bacterium]